MGQATLDRTLKLVRHLDRGELRQVEATVRDLLRSLSPRNEGERLDQALLESGLVDSLPDTVRTAPRRKPVPISGAPLSQTIIEDRR